MITVNVCPDNPAEARVQILFYNSHFAPVRRRIFRVYHIRVSKEEGHAVERRVRSHGRERVLDDIRILVVIAPYLEGRIFLRRKVRHQCNFAAAQRISGRVLWDNHTVDQVDVEQRPGE